ncbi:MAG TPA: hypothetical protein VGE07_26690 [Herpetosiphonaceae bacterium]
MSIHDLLAKLGQAERDFVAAQVLAPVLPGRPVAVRIAGVVCELTIDERQAEGWLVLQPLSTGRARVARPAGLGEIAAYARLLPAVRLVAVARQGRSWLALPASAGDRRFTFEGPAPVELAGEGLEPFDQLVARFDGRRFWFERRDEQRDPTIAAYLRQALADGVPPCELRRKGLSAEERAAYAWVVGALAEDARSVDERRLDAALRHAGARLSSFVERDEAYAVSYLVDGERHASLIRKDDLTVMTSGICLAGRDADFDLASLVGVLREADPDVPRYDLDDE